MLLDKLKRPIHDLRISVTDRCNFRCGYCMPKDKYGRDHQFLKRKELLTFEEIEKVARAFVALGVVKIRLTGGEPLVRNDLETLVRHLKQIDGLQDLSLTTNASLLSAKRAATLREAGIDRINISLDALDAKTFGQLNGVGYPVEDVLSGVENACQAGFEQVKVNMVVQSGRNEASVLPMLEYFIGKNVVLRFIEYMDVGNSNNWQNEDVFTAQQIKSLIETRYPIEALDANYRGEVARRWKLSGLPMEFGIISSVSEPFCGECSRARLSAIGEVYTCLFAGGGADLRELLRASDSEVSLFESIQRLWSERTDRYSELRSHQGPVRQKVEMSYIGG
jgi:cyclic pyranopterin phosphate synthase